MEQKSPLDIRAELYGLCEHMEDEADDLLVEAYNEHQEGFSAGQKSACKSIRRAMGEVFEQEKTIAWDRWYDALPDDLRARLSFHDFKRLGDVFQEAFLGWMPKKKAAEATRGEGG